MAPGDFLGGVLISKAVGEQPAVLQVQLLLHLGLAVDGQPVLG